LAGLEEVLTFSFAHVRVGVVVESRRHDRRVSDRRAITGAIDHGERRQIRSCDGRRFLERRAELVPMPAPGRLPRQARQHEARIAFAQRIAPAAVELEDADTNRLIAAFQSGRREVFTSIYARYQTRILHAIRAGVTDYHAAEDVTQDVFMRAMDKLGDFEIHPDRPLRGWLLGIARYEANNHRRKHRRLELVGIDEFPASAVDDPSAFDQRIFGVLTDPALGEIVAEMPERQREVIAMRYVCDLKLVEIAQLLGRSPESIRQLHVRALSHLEQRLCALGRGPTTTRASRSPVRVLLRQSVALRARRFVLTRSLGAPALSWRR
jgi:RNA polymerase sigma-70 factor (ECF subfamily)